MTVNDEQSEFRIASENEALRKLQDWMSRCDKNEGPSVCFEVGRAVGESIVSLGEFRIEGDLSEPWWTARSYLQTIENDIVPSLLHNEADLMLHRQFVEGVLAVFSENGVPQRVTVAERRRVEQPVDTRWVHTQAMQYRIVQARGFATAPTVEYGVAGGYIPELLELLGSFKRNPGISRESIDTVREQLALAREYGQKALLDDRNVVSFSRGIVGAVHALNVRKFGYVAANI